jgi:hypothetical protein
MWEIGLLSAGALVGVLASILVWRVMARRHKGRVSDLIRRHLHPRCNGTPLHAAMPAGNQNPNVVPRWASGRT